MAIYVVMEPPGVKATLAAERAVMVRDGFAFIAFLVPPLWLVWHRLWIEAILALAASIALTALGEIAGFGLLGGALSLMVSLFVGLEGQMLRVNALRRRGWAEWGVVEAGNVAEAEIRYLAGEEPAEATTVPLRATQAVAAPHTGIATRAATGAVTRAATGPSLGLLGYPGRR